MQCSQKGRRAHEAWQVGKHTFADWLGLAGAQTWTPATVGIGEEIWSCDGIARGVVFLARERLVFLERILGLFSRLPEAGVRSRCLRQWAGAAATDQHKVSRASMTVGTELNRQFLAVLDDGSNLGDLIVDEIRSLHPTRLEDSVGEAPHASANRIASHALAGGCCWLAQACVWVITSQICNASDSGADMNPLCRSTACRRAEWFRSDCRCLPSASNGPLGPWIPTRWVPTLETHETGEALWRGGGFGADAPPDDDADGER